MDRASKPNRMGIAGCCIVFSVILLGSLQPAHLRAAENDESSDVLIVKGTTATLLKYEHGEFVDLASLPGKTLLRANGNPLGSLRRGKIRYRKVDVVRRGRRIAGWIDCRDVFDVSAICRIWPRHGWASRPEPDEIPALIRINSQEVQQSWRDIQKAIQANEDLDSPLPEPYFALAELWTKVHNHDEAMKYYLRAAKLSLNSQNDLVNRARFFVALYESLEKRDRVPKPPPPGYAGDHYGYGYHAFWEGRLDHALKFFDDALQLDPEHPVYWYYRALTYKRLGKELRAEHDAREGAHWEYQNYSRSYYLKRSVARQLERVQGPLRRWLDGYRRGEPHFRPPKDKTPLKQVRNRTAQTR